MNINQRLKLLRESSGLTLEDVAKSVGVTKQTVQKYESGVVVSIPSDKIELLAEVYHVSPAYIMGWIDNPNHTDQPAPQQNGEFASYREQLRRQPGARMLLDAADDATDQEIEQWVNVINALKKKPYDD